MGAEAIAIQIKHRFPNCQSSCCQGTPMFLKERPKEVLSGGHDLVRKGWRGE